MGKSSAVKRAEPARNSLHKPSAAKATLLPQAGRSAAKAGLQPQVYATIGLSNCHLVLTAIFCLISLTCPHIRQQSGVAGLYIHPDSVAFL